MEVVRGLIRPFCSLGFDQRVTRVSWRVLKLFRSKKNKKSASAKACRWRKVSAPRHTTIFLKINFSQPKRKPVLCLRSRLLMQEKILTKKFPVWRSSVHVLWVLFGHYEINLFLKKSKKSEFLSKRNPATQRFGCVGLLVQWDFY